MNEKKYRAVVDIEAKNWIEFLVLGFYDGTEFIHFFSLEEFFFYLGAYFHNAEETTFFAHFGGGYDFLFLIDHVESNPDRFKCEMINRGTSILSLKIYDFHTKKTYSFVDSSALLSFSLAKLTDAFKVTHKKKEFDFENFKKFKKPFEHYHQKKNKLALELVEYLKYDCMGLYQCLEKFFSWDIFQGLPSKLTISSQALALFMKRYNVAKIKSLPKTYDEFCRKSYYGGRVEIYRPLKKKDKIKLHVYDINSLFPYAMREGIFYDKFKRQTKTYWPGEFGIYEVTIFVPEMFLPPLPVKHKGKLIFPTGTFTGVWTQIEINYALSLGCKIIDVKKGYIFARAGNGGRIFKNYVDDLYKRRQQSTSEVDNVLCKLMLNSLYGRMGFNSERTKIVYDTGDLGQRPLVGKKAKWTKRRRFAEMDTTIFGFSHSAIAAQILSYARVYHHKLMLKNQKHLYYGDTDSIFTTKKNKSGKKLGDLKLEYSLDQACFLLPKTYMGESPLKKIVKIKGFSSRKIQHFDYDDFYSMLEGEIRALKAGKKSFKGEKVALSYEEGETIARFKSALKKGKILSLRDKQIRNIRSFYDKREFIFEKNGDISTRPLNLQENKE